MKLSTVVLFCVVVRVDGDDDVCPISCMCTLAEGNQTGIKWLACNDFPRRIPANATHLTVSNRSVRVLTVDTFEPNKHLKFLQLRSLELEEIQDGSFDRFESLRKLDLSGNRLARVENGTFNASFYLEELDLRSNLIREISSHAFRNLVWLRSLDLSHNLLTEFPDLRPALSLVDVDLSHNSIVDLPRVDDRFVGIPIRLQRLDLCANNFAAFEAKLMAPDLRYVCLGDNLQEFDSPHNGVDTLEIRSESFNVKSFVNGLRRLPNIKSLTLALATIPARTNADFHLHELRTLRLKRVRWHRDDDGNDNLFLLQLDLMHLETLELDGTPEIARFILSSDRALEKFASLVHLKLENCDLSGVTGHQIGLLKNVRNLSLLGNPLKCDCQIEWLLRSPIALLRPEQMLCHWPVEYRGLRLFSSSVHLTKCEDDVLETTPSPVNPQQDNGGDAKRNGAHVTIYHVVYSLIALTGLLIVAFLIVIILLCKSRHRSKRDESRVAYRRRYSLDVLPDSDRHSEFSMQIAASNDVISDDPRPYSTLTFHPRREKKHSHVASIENTL